MVLKILLYILFAYTLIFNFSCTNKESYKKIILPPDSILKGHSNWGVVTSNYLRLRQRPAKNSEVLTGIPKGMIVEILSNTEKMEILEKVTAFWYRINFDGLYGWVFGAYIEVFNTRQEAESYSKEIR